MSSLWPRIEPLLARVEKPARYIGMEKGSLAPDHGPRRAAFLLIYPDTYEIGLPNQGLQILYEILNERDDAVAERAYAPWIDMEPTMRAAGVPLFSVDTHRAATDFDVLAFNLSAELVYTNVLNLVDLAGVPVRNEDRAPSRSARDRGRALHVQPRAARGVRRRVRDRRRRRSRQRDRRSGRRVEARAAARRAKRCCTTSPRSPACTCRRCTTSNTTVPRSAPSRRATPTCPRSSTSARSPISAEWPYPKNQLVPLVEVVHDRLNVEIFRGLHARLPLLPGGDDHPARCANGPRSRSRTHGPRRPQAAPATTRLRSRRCRAPTSRASTASSPTSSATRTGTGAVSVSLPSLRVDAFSVGIASEIQKVRRTGLTFAPEAGSWRLRQVINKLIVEDDLYSAVDAAYSQGWRRVKLYFLTGLPTEMDADTLGIAELAANVVDIGRKYNKQASCTVSVGGFVPKPHTPFQWFGQNGVDELQRKITMLRGALQGHAGPAEVARSRRDVRGGDRARAATGASAGSSSGCGARAARSRSGASASRSTAGSTRMHAEGLDPDWYVTRHRTRDEVLPWAPHRGRAACRLPLGRLAGGPAPSTGSPIAAGRRATTVGCVPTTPSSMWWRRRCRRRADRKARARI